MKLLRRFVLILAVSLGVSLQAKTYDLIDLGRPPAGTPDDRFLSDPILNNSGTIALTARDAAPDGITRAFVFRAGAYAEIPNPMGWNITVESLNDFDDIVGGLYLTDFDEDPLVFRDGFLYNAATAQFQLVSTLTGIENVSPLRINNSGVLLLASDFDDLAVVYDAGMVFRFDDVDPSFQYAVAWELNNAGQLLFNPDLTFPSPYVPDFWESNQFLYTLGAPAAEPLPEGTPWTPSWIHFSRVNDQGVVAGGSEIGLVLYQSGGLVTIDAMNVNVAEINNASLVVGMYGPWDARRPFLYDGKTFKDVNDLPFKGGLRGWTLISASGVNDLGQIVGLMQNSQGEVHVYLLSPSRPLKASLGELKNLFRQVLGTLTGSLLFGFR